MTIDLAHFTPTLSFIGGIIIGLAAAVLIVFNARIAGISGIIASALSHKLGEHIWRYAFIAGLVISPLIYGAFLPLPLVQNVANLPTLAVAGLLVGIGTQYASGCTSGHGICGLSRFSLRSLVATISFMAAGFVTVTLVRHWIA